MWNWFKIFAFGIVTLFAAVAASWARDIAYQVHAIIIMVISAGMFVWSVRTADDIRPPEPTGYMDGVIRYGVVATTFWGLAGFLVGTFIAFQLAFPSLNFELLQGYVPPIKEKLSQHIEGV